MASCYENSTTFPAIPSRSLNGQRHLTNDSIKSGSILKPEIRVSRLFMFFSVIIFVLYWRYFQLVNHLILQCLSFLLEQHILVCSLLSYSITSKNYFHLWIFPFGLINNVSFIFCFLFFFFRFI